MDELTLAKHEAIDWARRAGGMSVDTKEDYKKAAEFLRGLRALRKKIGETFDPIIKKAHEAHKTALDEKKKADGPLRKAEGYLMQMMSNFTVAEEKRLEAEARARQEAEKKKAEDERLDQAEQLEKEGRGDVANQLLEAPVVVPEVKAVQDRPKAEGISHRIVWKFKVEVPSLVPDEYKSIDMTKIGGIVRAMKDKTAIPGVRVFWEKTTVVDSRY